ncbi:hypothetical protein PHYSODRAFT_306102 [Phytophthora sojae]|uniref:Uncharacterized protein n=1 Tax=Phytophthora sojae (strain P6497) TaxID=1094619 RepID=G5A7W6_PHYSP|nr:hypothetical protein PHYSODRAFT_306102 [Phytophthora sojae]EGZ07992.1 hypothetical protein PHYSODRAFT_306102 [Phytophthora sojae]|eukprot:XP_009536164.1 hypothetical protein PHYSODRAFT_306102 [Phytophthora sojae]
MKVALQSISDDSRYCARFVSQSAAHGQPPIPHNYNFSMEQSRLALSGQDGYTYECTVEIVFRYPPGEYNNWSCEVTKDNMDQFVTSSGIRVSGNLHVFMGILHDIIEGNLPRWAPSTQAMSGNLRVARNPSPYYMELKLQFQLRDLSADWTFPMIPDNASDIQAREAAKLMKIPSGEGE